MTIGRLKMLAPMISVLDVRNALPGPKLTNSFYLSKEWRELVARLIKLRGRRCEKPGCGRTGCRIFGNHIKELQDGGGKLDPGNVELLCGSCHTKHTNQQRAIRIADPV